LWVPYVVGARTAIAVAMDWTDFDADNQATLMLSLITEHGRATPLLWLTVDKKTLKDRRNLYEDRLLGICSSPPGPVQVVARTEFPCRTILMA
jgi:hypothetical protein